MRIHDIPLNNRPREKALRYGIDKLSDCELLALVIGSGVRGKSALEISSDILKEYQCLQTLANSHSETLENVHGLSTISALKLSAVFEMHKRLMKPINNSAEIICTSKDVYERYKYLETYPQEMIILVMMNKSGKILREQTVNMGSEKIVEISVKDIITSLLLGKCQKYVLIHNHPNGHTGPSEHDICATSIIKEKTAELDIELFDHIIIYVGGYYSFLEKGKLEYL